MTVEIGPESDARIQIDDQEPLAILSASVERDVLRSCLTGVTWPDGRAATFPGGARVTLYQGPAVVFVGRVDEYGSIVDLVSAQADAGEDFEDI